MAALQLSRDQGAPATYTAPKVPTRHLVGVGGAVKVWRAGTTATGLVARFQEAQQ